eukprot:m.197322 g.197322  ORF g.197322 m.197322 type:complete len:658 (-) comp32658_c0_seq2:339-2312(-)
MMESSSTKGTAFQSSKPDKPLNKRPRKNPALAAVRAALPIAQTRTRLLHEIRKHSTVIVVGETGSGKTTQLPQYLFEAKFAKGKQIIGCTQPRRVAAVTVAQRVAEEMGTSVGQLVGYSVRFDENTSHHTKLKYLTDGMMLREAMTDPKLSKYSVIILDEAHERTLHTDVLFAVVKAIQKKRSDLKIVIMSATLEAESFSSYFNNCPILYIRGRQHPVSLLYTQEPQTDYLDSTFVTILQIHQEKPLPGDILVFLTGQDEIESLEKLLKQALIVRPDGCPNLKVCPIYGALPAELQLKVFEPAPKHARKVILATNIAETSLTINGILYVVDTGFVKQRIYNPRTGLDTLSAMPTSQAQASQRCGRAGREAAGTCYRLYPESLFSTLAPSTTPEILRGNLGTVVLQLLTMGVTNVINFDYMDPPSTDALEAALWLLFDLGAIDEDKKLTKVGKLLAQFPLEPKLAKVVASSTQYGCGDEILSIIAMMSVENIFHTPQSKRDEVDAARRRFFAPHGDHMTLLNVYNEYKGVDGNAQWCSRNFINKRSLTTVINTRKQLRQVCVRLGMNLESSRADSVLIRKCLLAGLFSQVAELSGNGLYKSLKTGQLAQIHPTSTLFSGTSPMVIYTEMTKTTKLYLRSCTTIEYDWLNEVAPDHFKK